MPMANACNKLAEINTKAPALPGAFVFAARQALHAPHCRTTSEQAY